MGKAADEHGPVLRGIGVFVDLFGDHLAQPSVLCEPLASGAADRVPADLDRPLCAIDHGFCHGDYVGHMSKTGSVFDGQFAFSDVLLPGRLSANGAEVLASKAWDAGLYKKRIQELPELVSLPLPITIGLWFLRHIVS